MNFIRDLGLSISPDDHSEEGVADVDSNWVTSLTRFTEHIANYTLQSLAASAEAASMMMTTTEVPTTMATGTTTITTLPPLIVQVTTAAINVAASAIMANASGLDGDSGVDNGYASPSSSSLGNDDPPTRLEHAPQLSKSSLVKAYVLSVMAVMSLIGNVATMWNIYKTRMARRSSRHTWSAIYSLMFHLSIADLLVTGFCIIGEAAWYFTVQWVADDLTCKLVKLFQMFSLYLSTYVLVLIGVDRWIAVKYPMKSLNMAKRCYRLLGGTYVLSFVLSLPQFFIFHVSKGPFIEEFYQCVTHGFYTALWQEQLYATFTMVFTFLLPLCILFGTYLSTFRTISNSEKMFQGSKLAVYSNKPSVQTNRQRLIHKAKMKSLRISVVIIFAFLICWTPYNIMMIIFTFSNPDKGQGEDLQSGIFFFGMSNSLVNPLIYGAFHLCPMKRKASKYSSNPHSLTRGDSQRTPSLLTAVTQVETNCRSTRSTFRQASYYRSQSNGSSYKEHVGLLQTTPTALKKSASMRSPLPSHHPHPHLHLHPQQDQPQHQHQTLSWGVAVPSSKAGGTSCTITSAAGTNPKTGSVSLNGLVGPKENVSSV